MSFQWNLAKLRLFKSVLVSILKIIPVQYWSDPVLNGWALKDIVAHLVEWDKITITTIKSFLNGLEIEWIENENDFNSRAVALWSDKYPLNLLHAFERVSRDMIYVYETVPSDKLSQPFFPGRKENIIGQLQIDTDHHFEHLQTIFEYLNVLVTTV